VTTVLASVYLVMLIAAFLAVGALAALVVYKLFAGQR
jgi:hypothetical protein